MRTSRTTRRMQLRLRAIGGEADARVAPGRARRLRVLHQASFGGPASSFSVSSNMACFKLRSRFAAVSIPSLGLRIASCHQSHSTNNTIPASSSSSSSSKHHSSHRSHPPCLVGVISTPLITHFIDFSSIPSSLKPLFLLRHSTSSNTFFAFGIFLAFALLFARFIVSRFTSPHHSSSASTTHSLSSNQKPHFDFVSSFFSSLSFHSAS